MLSGKTYYSTHNYQDGAMQRILTMPFNNFVSTDKLTGVYRTNALHISSPSRKKNAGVCSFKTAHEI